MNEPCNDFRMAMLASIGYAPESIEPGRIQRFPTSDKRGDKAGWSVMFEDLRGGVFGCYRAGHSETWSSIDRRSMTSAESAALAAQVLRATIERQEAQRKQWAVNAERNAALAASCVPVSVGDPVARYLASRGLSGPVPLCIRLHPGLPYWEDGQCIGTFPAMAAGITDEAGRLVSIHRTYFTDDGRKADVPTVRKLTGASAALRGACIALNRPARGVIGIAEGVETALAAHRASGVPTVAAYSAGNLAAWSWPRDARRLIVFADADDAGREAAAKLRARASASGLGVSVMAPTAEGEDWADVWAQGRLETEVRA